MRVAAQTASRGLKKLSRIGFVIGFAISFILVGIGYEMSMSEIEQGFWPRQACNDAFKYLDTGRDTTLSKQKRESMRYEEILVTEEEGDSYAPLQVEETEGYNRASLRYEAV